MADLAPIFSVLTATDRFDVPGALYAVGDQVGVGRWVRIVSNSNPRPNLDSPDYPPTFVSALDVELAFGLPAVREFRPFEQFDLFEGQGGNG